MKFKKIIVAGLAAATCFALAACDNITSDDSNVLKIAALEGGHGDFITALAEQYEANNEGLTVEVTISSNIEEIIRPQILAGNTPDFMYLPTGRPLALTETLLKDDAVLELTNMLKSTIPGEDVTVEEKVLDGFFDTTATNPYGDGKTYLAPLFYSPTGLFYNQDNFGEGKYDLPTTWDDMFELGATAETDNVALFTYPTAGYFDGFMFSLMGVTGGNDLFDACTNYEDGIWTSSETDFMFETIENIKPYLLSTTVGNANGSGYLDNQKAVMDNRALFIPNGSWLPGEMSNVTPADGFEWGFMGLPQKDENGSSYAYTYMEQMYIPKYGANTAEAEKFMAWLYSDEACEIILENTSDHAPTPINGSVDKMKTVEGLDPVNITLFETYDNGTKPMMGGFITTSAVEGVDFSSTFYGNIDAIMKGEKTISAWRDEIEAASDLLRATIN